METKRELSLNHIFWRYLFSTAALWAVLCGVWFFFLCLLIQGGLVLRADAGEQNLAQTAALLQAQEDFSPDVIPFYYRWALVEEGTLGQTNMTQAQQRLARRFLAGDSSPQGLLYPKYHWPVPLSGGRLCLLQYDYRTHYATPDWQESLPDFQITALLVLLLLLGLTALGKTRRYTALLRQDVKSVTLSCDAVARRELTADSPNRARIKEFQAALTALDTLRRELAASLQAQWEAEQQKQELLASLAHDLKTPLTVIGGNAELLSEDALSPEQQACVQAILRGADHAGDYVTRLCAAAAESPLPAARVPVSLSHLAQTWATLGRDLAGSKGVSFHWAAGPLPQQTVLVEEDTLLRALENLMSNGIRYTPRGKDLLCGMGLSHQVTALWVQDGGPGFSPEALSKAGKTFYTESASRPQEGHLGLGLYSVLQTARAHGGGLLLENTPIGGRVTLWLPQTPSPRTVLLGENIPHNPERSPYDPLPIL